MGDEIVLLKVAEAAKRLSLSRSKVYELIAAGAIDSVTIGRSRRISRAAIEKFIRGLQVDEE
jgi:excisionase family DNA binding protein